MSKSRFAVGFPIFILISLILSCNYYQGPPSDHFDGSHFFNKEPEHTFFEHIKWLWDMETVEWPDWINDPPQPPPVANIKKGELRITYINQATTLIQMDGINILTDPIWSERAGPFSWMGSKRVRAPGVKMEDLPNIDIILISHDHYDHLDLPTLEKLFKKHQPFVLVGLGVKRRLESIKQNDIIELDWCKEYTYSTDTKITFVPSLHGSGRGLFSGNETLWGGFVIEGSSGRVLFMGDTGFGDFLTDIQKRYPNFQSAILPIENYEKRWFMKTEHMNPDDAVRVHKMLNVTKSVGIHFSTFKEHPEQAINAHEKDLQTALEKYNIQESDFWILKFGEGREVIKLEE